MFREPLDEEYATKFTLTTGTIQPLAFPDIIVAVDLLIFDNIMNFRFWKYKKSNFNTSETRIF